MKIKQCEDFLKLVETKSFSRAAEALFISKQGLSRSIRSLEEELGVSLFVRTVYGTELSPAGERILPEVSAMYNTYQQIREKLASVEPPASNRLRILLPYSFFLFLPFELIFSFLSEKENVQVQYAYCAGNEIEQKLLEEDFDLAFCSKVVRREQFHCFPLFENYYCFVLHKEHPFTKKRFIGIEDLSGMRMAVLASEYEDCSYLHRNILSADPKVDIFPCYEGTLLPFASERSGITFMFTNLVKQHPSPDTRYVFMEDFRSSAYDVDIIVPRRKKRGVVMRAFIDHAQQFCRNALIKRPNFPLD